ncbi:putative Restriction modification system DNA specificity domain [Desulfamplus magnetovallimortis]|uniref:Putative Restriction modification system DNA specificity domain n=1 Tax=Desulfamplus magnetovallimortis TaxID=1246637 RepID=A0A1W1HD76_9BACT|nr:restriction endonuclease subunit S [Desulfamplus magnetovallimortis]SLM30430.1 putative Restriction modification system DNA specificity domain [Desulfamplus magnetovallimortis]
MKPYPKYKDSGVEWMGEIPEHWDRNFLKRYCNNITDGSHFSPPTQDEGMAYISVKDIGNNTIDTINCKKISEPDFLKLVESGCQPDLEDILLTKDGTIGRAAIVKEDNNFVILSSLGLIKPNNLILTSNFLRYYLISGLNIDQMYSFIHGSALTRLTIVLIKHLYTIVPPLHEQQKIATFLDHKTHQIDTLIEKKKRLIDLLKEERTAVINEAVTKGLDPDVPMKDSGIEWLGEIPEHWDVVKLKWLTVSVKTGSTPPSIKVEYFKNGNLNWFTPADFHKNMFLYESKRKITSHAINDGVANIYKAGSVFLVGIGATLGNIGIINYDSSCNQQINTITFNDNLNPYYGAYYLTSKSDVIVSCANSSTLAIFNQSQTKNILMLFPPSKRARRNNKFN